MTEIIKINYDGEQATVSARELHEKLEIKTRFNDWFPRMCEYGFAEGKDFYSKMSKTSEVGGRPAEDYDLTIRCGKEICMLQRTDIGRKIRNYFLDLEEAWNTPEQVFARALKMADRTIDSLKERCKFLGNQVIEKQMQIEEMQPKATYYDLILQCPDLVSVTVVAKDYGMSATKFNSLLHEHGVQFKQGGVWVLYRDYDHFGYTSTKTHNYSDSVGVQHSKPHMYWTQKGRLFLYDFLKNKGIVLMIESMA